MIFVNLKEESTYNLSAILFKFQIEILNLQIIHQKLEFMACGYFPINFSLLNLVVGTIITYLLFFIQFEIESRNKMGMKAD